MRVLYIKDRFCVHDRRFLRAIMEQGHTPVAVQLSDELGDSQDAGVGIHKLSPDSLAEFACGVAPDVVHVGPMSAAAIAVEYLPARLPMVVVSWGSDILRDCSRDAVSREQAIGALRRADAVIADCSAVPSAIRAWLPDYRTPFVTFPWGVDVGVFNDGWSGMSDELRYGLGWVENEVFVSTRAWEPGYGVDILLAAFARLVGSANGSRLILIGDGSLRGDIFRMIESKGLTKCVHAPGRVAELDLPAWYGAADVYVSSSSCDGSSVSLLEAMASRKPVLGHNEFGNLDWIKPGVNGWLADCRDDEALAEAMQRALDARQDWGELGQVGRDLVLKNADWAMNSPMISRAYRLAVKQRALV